MNESGLHLLLVEDDDVAAEGVERAVRGGRLRATVHRAKDGLDALDALRGTGGRARVPRPHLLLLDLRMPRMDGLQFLRVIRADPELAASVVFLLTTSTAARDRIAAYDHHVAGYIPKARLGSRMSDLVELLVAYEAVVDLPREPAAGGGAR